MKYAPPIQLSTFEIRRRRKKAQSVNYLEGFWTKLIKDTLDELIARGRPQIKALVSTSVRFVSLSFKRAAISLKGWRARPHLITVRFRWLWLAFWMVHFYPTPRHTVYADPILLKHIPAQLQTIEMPPLEPQELLQPVFVSKLRDYGTYSNTYAPFNCTSYVASRLPIPDNWGNANNWAYSASSAGYDVSSVPQLGAIATNTTDSDLGHVAIVAEISDGMVRLEEQNYEGPGVISGDRWAPISQYQYIYV